jgi:hypothetical protein
MSSTSATTIGSCARPPWGADGDGLAGSAGSVGVEDGVPDGEAEGFVVGLANGSVVEAGSTEAHAVNATSAMTRDEIAGLGRFICGHSASVIGVNV